MKRMVLSGALAIAISLSSISFASASDLTPVDTYGNTVEHNDDIGMEETGAPSTPERQDDELAHAAGIRLGTCRSRADYVHVTRGEASGHAWWERIGKNCNVSKSVVTIRLQAQKNGRWVNVTSNQKSTIGPGTYKRANARKACQGATRTTWRSAYEVDYLGVIDPVQWHYSPAVTIPCGA